MRGTSVLNIDQSLLKARWVSPLAQQDVVDRIALTHNLPEMLARLLEARGVPFEEIESFLNPKLSRDFPDPCSMAGMREAAEQVADLIASGNKNIGIFADFDVDGSTSAAILKRFFAHFGIDAMIYIPDRLAEGYGPNLKALQSMQAAGVQWVLMADCGISAHQIIEGAREGGLNIIILDHHEPKSTLPPANHVVDPKRADDTSGLTMLAAVGVSFMLCVAVNGVLRQRGWFTEGRREAPLKNWLDIVALGTVCDMVPLKGVNRLIVRHGFARMAETNNPGLKALCAVAGITTAPTPFHAGFQLGPRINAGSRVHQADLGAKLLSTDNADEARNIAFTLDDCNKKRRAIQSDMMREAVALVEAKNLQDAPVIIVGDEGWHPGLSGLVAGKLKEQYKRPAIVVTYADCEDGTREGRGSGRSIPGVNIAAAFQAAEAAGLLIKGGGHAMAGGFTLDAAKLDEFSAFVRAHVESQMAGNFIAAETLIDAVISVRGVRPDAIRTLHDHIGPFGVDHPEPVFALANVRLHNVDIVGDNHVRCMVSDWEGGPRIKAMAFGAADTPLGQALLQSRSNTPFHLAGCLKLDTWQGEERVELHIQDGAPVLASENLRQSA